MVCGRRGSGRFVSCFLEVQRSIYINVKCIVDLYVHVVHSLLISSHTRSLTHRYSSVFIRIHSPHIYWWLAISYSIRTR